PEIFHAFTLGGIPCLTLRELVVRAIDINRHEKPRIGAVVDEVGPSLALLDELLRVRGEPVAPLGDQIEPTLLEVGRAKPKKPLQVLRPGEPRWRDLDLGRGKLDEEVLDRLSVEELVVGLVTVAQKARIAR